MRQFRHVLPADKKGVYDSFYRHQRRGERMPFQQFSVACDLIMKERFTRAKIARMVSTQEQPVNETRIRRLATFLNAKTGDRSYARRAESLKLSNRFPGAVERYLELRRSGRLSNQKAAAAVGVDRYTALDWERALLSPEERARLESIVKSASNAHPRRNEMRLLLGVKNFDGSFRYPPKAIMDALGVKLDAIRTANAATPVIRQKPDIDDVAKRFVGGRRVEIPALAEEAKQLLPKLLKREKTEADNKHLRQMLALSQNKRLVFETKLVTAMERNGISPQDFAGLKTIIHELFSAPAYEVPVREIHSMQKIPETVRHNLVSYADRMRTSDGMRLVKIEDVTVKLNPDTAKFIT